MRICHVDPACGLSIPPKGWGAIEKIIWEFEKNQRELGHDSTHKLQAHINAADFDIVHSHVANLSVGLAQRGVPYIFQLHDHHVLHWGKDSHVYKQNLEAIEGSLISLVPSRELVRYFDHPKVKYFAHGVNNSEFYPSTILKPKPEQPRLLMVANNGLGGHGGFDRKGFKWGVALAKKHNLHITIAGPSNNKNFFNENLWILDYDKLDIIFDLPNEKLLDLYQSHDIFLHPSSLEAGHPNLTLIEAAACGLPIIGWIEMETDFHGMWRAPRDLWEMERGLFDIMDNWDAYVTASLATARNLDWKNRTIELLKIYETFHQIS